MVRSYPKSSVKTKRLSNLKQVKQNSTRLKSSQAKIKSGQAVLESSQVKRLDQPGQPLQSILESNSHTFPQDGDNDPTPLTQPTSSSLLKTLRSPIGSYGTASYGGYASEEYLSTLRGRQRADIFDEIRRSDSQAKMCLSAVKNPIKSGTWEIQPADNSDIAKLDAEFIEHILFHGMNQSWGAWLIEALTCCDFGHSVFETIHKIVLNDPKFGSYIGIQRLAFRSQRTIERWNLDSATGELKSVTQYAFGDIGKTIDIPAENLLLFSIDQEGANHEGISMLRPCYGNWFRKNEYLKLNAIGIERCAIPTPMAEIPENKQNSTQYNNLVEVLQKFITNQANYITYPAGWKIELNNNTYNPANVEASIDAEDKRMVKSFMANFLELGMSGSGAYALSNDLSDFFLSGLDHIAKQIEDPINLKLIPSLIEMNRGKRSQYPKLSHCDISDKAGKELADILRTLAEGQFIIPDAPLEDQLRKRYRLSKRSSDGQRLKPIPQSQVTSYGLADRIRMSEARRERIAG